jgi:Uma2 family endonuclease
MSTIVATPPRPSTLGRAHRLSVMDYHRMGETGIIGPELRTELIDGEIIEMPPIGHPHAGTLNLLVKRLIVAVGDRAVVAPQNPVNLNDYTEPLPDIALLKPRADYYRNAHPGPADVLLLIEVADTSLAYDRDVKLPRYARAGIPEAWLLDLGGRRLTIHRCPAGDAYTESVAVGDLRTVAVPTSGDGAGVVVLDLRALF